MSTSAQEGRKIAEEAWDEAALQFRKDMYVYEGTLRIHEQHIAEAKAAYLTRFDAQPDKGLEEEAERLFPAFDGNSPEAVIDRHIARAKQHGWLTAMKSIAGASRKGFDAPTPVTITANDGTKFNVTGMANEEIGKLFNWIHDTGLTQDRHKDAPTREEGGERKFTVGDIRTAAYAINLEALVFKNLIEHLPLQSSSVKVDAPTAADKVCECGHLSSVHHQIKNGSFGSITVCKKCGCANPKYLK